MKTRLLLIVVIFSALILLYVFFTAGINPILHLIYSDEHMLKTSMSSEIVKAFLEMYPDSKVRYTRFLDYPPSIVFEMIKDNRMAFLAVGNFEGDDLAYMYHCMTPDYSHTFIDVTPTFTINDIMSNPCFISEENEN